MGRVWTSLGPASRTHTSGHATAPEAYTHARRALCMSLRAPRNSFASLIVASATATMPAMDTATTAPTAPTSPTTVSS